MKKILWALVAWSALTGAASAFCSNPDRPPQAPGSFDKPRPPSCLASAGYDGEHDCKPSEIDRYRVEVEQYVAALERFAVEAQRFAQSAVEYAQCEAEEARESLGA
jgi:hypothetical protein